MPALPVISFLIGAVAMAVAIKVLYAMPITSWRSGPIPKAAAAGVLVTPLLVLLLTTGKQGLEPADALASATTTDSLAVALPADEFKQDAEWATIAHAYMGGPPPGAAVAGDAPVQQRAKQSVAELEAATRKTPDNAQHWFALAQTQRLARDYPSAAKAYAAGLKLDPSNADAWADYADALASANNRRLEGEPAKAVARVLSLQPNHLKGLWLAASLDLETRRYDQALARWQQLRAVLPTGSPDIAIIDSNIAEARHLANPSAATAPGT
jgi:tetratricopeptide (TPR) repeat protein